MLDVVRTGLPAALEAGAEALRRPAVPLAACAVAAAPGSAHRPRLRGLRGTRRRRRRERVRRGRGAPEWYEAPTFYFTNPYALLGAHDDVPVPPGCELFDFELEVAAVVGRDGASLSPEQARQAIFGYTILNDWSARDLQRREMKVQLGPAKGKDSATTLGPWLVTADELAAHHDEDGFLTLEMSVSVNSARIGHDLLSNMGWPFAELVSYASRGTWVRAGDVLGSGTCGNGGCLAELWGRGRDIPALAPGDVVEMTVEGLGTIRNTVVTGTTLPPVPAARPRSGRRTR